MKDNAACLEKEFKTYFRLPVAGVVFLVAAALLFAALGVWNCCHVRTWEKRFETWKTVKGTVVEKKKAGKEGFRYEYVFTWNKRLYRGNRIAFDSTSPDLKKGGVYPVIFDPDSPGGRNSALRIVVREKWYWIYYWLPTWVFWGFALFSLGGIWSELHRRKGDAQIPENLKLYLNTFTKEEILSLKERKFEKICKVRNSVLSLEKTEDLFYLNVSRFSFADAVWAILYPGMSVFLLWIGAWKAATLIGALWGISFGLYLVAGPPPCAVIDGRERKIYFCRSWSRKRMAQPKEVLFSEVEYLSVATPRKTGQGLRITVYAVLKDGSALGLFTLCPGKNWRQGLQFLPELAEKCGHLPVVFEL